MDWVAPDDGGGGAKRFLIDVFSISAEYSNVMGLTNWTQRTSNMLEKETKEGTKPYKLEQLNQMSQMTQNQIPNSIYF